MLILGLQGSPRKKGNTNFLLSTFLQAAEQKGAATRIIPVTERNILPCKEYVVCEKKGTCPIDDDMAGEIYGWLRQAEVVVLASPIFFYNMTSQLKAMVDRCQVFWARKYRLKLSDPLKATRRGFLLSVAATRGKTLFDGLQLTAKYFFDAIDARFEDSLVYRGIEGPKDMANHPTVREDVDRAVARLMAHYTSRKKVLFLCRRNACLSPMAGAWAQHLAGGRLDVATGGSEPAERTDSGMTRVMAEQGVDMAFRTPQGIDAALANGAPDAIITMGGDAPCPVVPGAQRQAWDVPDPAGKPIEVMRQVRDEIETRVKQLIATLVP
ncbi:MAG: NAD(P)H-dependent oxidoreductase [Deltaproteobacteria bacterium]|nr:NAD(P)H-dependent oxidoreductase [Deltaproteobacteria bacterium]